MQLSFRAAHGWLSFFGALFFLLTIVTGMSYAALSAWTPLKHAQLKVLLQLHQMSLLGISAYYVPALAVLLLAQLLTGLVLLWRRLRSMKGSAMSLNSARGTHASSTLIGGGAVAAALMAVSGAMYRINKTWLGRKEAASWWMVPQIRRFFFGFFF